MHQWSSGPPLSHALAEGQKARTLRDFTTPPPPPTKTVGGGGRISREICRFFAFGPSVWRKGVKSPRKMQILSCSLGTAIGLGLHRAVHSGHLTSSPPFQVIMAR